MQNKKGGLISYIRGKKSIEIKTKEEERWEQGYVSRDVRLFIHRDASEQSDGLIDRLTQSSYSQFPLTF